MKKVRVVLSEDAETVFNDLNKKAASSKRDKMILNAIKKKVELIKNNIHYGEPVAKSKIPTEYKKKYEITNSFWVNLPQYWRMLYTLTNSESEIEIIAFILDLINHKQYDKKFHY